MKSRNCIIFVDHYLVNVLVLPAAFGMFMGVVGVTGSVRVDKMLATSRLDIISHLLSCTISERH